VSKPGLYREFGSDDGLKTAALETYQRLAIAPFLALLRVDQPMAQTVEHVIDFLTQGKDALELPAGCLFVSMRGQRSRLGPRTMARLDDVREEFLAALRTWFDALRENSALKTQTPTHIAAHQVDVLHSGAMRMQIEQVPQQEIKEFLRFGFADLLGAPVS
jgi:AcrR family transcriptional regulator